MTFHHRYFNGGDERPQKSTAFELWKLAILHNLKSVTWVACILIILCYTFGGPVILSTYSLTSYGADERPRTGLDISSSTPEEIITQPITSDVTRLIDFSVGGCNIWRGEWIPHPDGPAYTNTSCGFIHEHQNCLGNGIPDLGFLYWRWKPYECALPLFDATAFLNIVAGKKWAFIGDSLARNHLQSVLCLLSQVEMPEYNPEMTDFYFRSYNFTLAAKWAPFLMKFTEDEVEGFVQGIAKLYVDVVNEDWATSLHAYDYIAFSAAHWFIRPSLYFVQNKLVGGLYLEPTLNVTEVGLGYGYRAALRTVFDFLITSEYKGTVFFRTFAPAHWENGAWDQGGNCKRKAPFQSDAITLEGVTLDIYKIQVEEFAKTLQRSSEFLFKLKILEVTHATLLRPDAHPGPYGYFRPKIQNDCLHWCLPGAADTWSAMLLDVLRHL